MLSPSAREGVGGVGEKHLGNSLSLPLGKREMTLNVFKLYG